MAGSGNVAPVFEIGAVVNPDEPKTRSSAGPLALFIYRRPHHLRSVIEALLKCDGIGETPIVVFADGPRSAREQVEVDAARAVALEMLANRAEFRFSDTNKGLSRSIFEGVTEILAMYDRVIVLEDDLQPSLNFLRFVNTALDRYKDDANVMQVSGHMYDVPEFAARKAALFLPLTTSWGWGTWKRAWQQFDLQATGWPILRTDQGLRRRFDLDGAYDYAAMLERQMEGHIDSWAIRWYWSVFSSGRSVLFPPVTLVRNTGLDGSGTHGRGWLKRLHGRASLGPTEIPEMPLDVSVSGEDVAAVRRAIWRQSGGRVRRLINSARRARLVLGRTISKRER